MQPTAHGDAWRGVIYGGRVSGSLRVVVADDSLLVREGVVAILGALDGVEVVAECADLGALTEAVGRLVPDVVLTDICMPPSMTDEGIRAAKAIRAQYPGIGVVVLSQFAEPEFVLDLFEHGSDRLAYLLKDRVGEPVELERALRRVAAGGSVVDPQIVDVLGSARSGRASVLDRLTPREREVMALIAQGYNNLAIAQRLVLSEKAVAKHINSIFSKLDLAHDDDSHRRVKAVLTWLSDLP